VTFLDHIERRLAALEAAHLLRSPQTLDSPTGPRITIGGRELLNLCSNDYLGLAADPALRGALSDPCLLLELGTGASRLITGTRPAHRELEAALAQYVRLPSALLFSSGYAANVGAIQALVGPGDLILSDELNHASLIDGCRLSRARVLVYRHRDLEHARSLLREHRAAHRAALVITESLFSMVGDTPPLRELRALATDADAGLLVDEAHALGVHGPDGRGLCARETVSPDVLVGTLGKAFGSSGAFVAAAKPVVQLLQSRARSHVFSTAPPAWLAHAARLSLSRLEGASSERDRLHAHARRLHHALGQLGFSVPPASAWLGPILPVLLGSPARALEASARLFDLGVFVQAIRPPTVAPGTSRLRLTPMATHTEADVDAVIDAFRACSSHF